MPGFDDFLSGATSPSRSPFQPPPRAQPQSPGLLGPTAPPGQQSPPGSPEELASRTSGWARFLEQISKPENSRALLDFGGQLLQPRPPGQTQAGAIGGALVNTAQARLERSNEERRLTDTEARTREAGRRTDVENRVANARIKLIDEQINELKSPTARPGAIQALAEQMARFESELDPTISFKEAFLKYGKIFGGPKNVKTVAEFALQVDTLLEKQLDNTRFIGDAEEREAAQAELRAAADARIESFRQAMLGALGPEPLPEEDTARGPILFKSVQGFDVREEDIQLMMEQEKLSRDQVLGILQGQEVVPVPQDIAGGLRATAEKLGLNLESIKGLQGRRF